MTARRSCSSPASSSASGYWSWQVGAAQLVCKQRPTVLSKAGPQFLRHWFLFPPRWQLKTHPIDWAQAALPAQAAIWSQQLAARHPLHWEGTSSPPADVMAVCALARSVSVHCAAASDEASGDPSPPPSASAPVARS